MDNLTQLISVPAITAICYSVIELYKHAVNSNEKFLRLIPVVGATLGLILGIVAFYCAKSIIAVDNVLTAMLVGLSSGLAATGTHQIFKQLTKGGLNEQTQEQQQAQQLQQAQEPQQTQQAQQAQEVKEEVKHDTQQTQ